jgi:murein DD-endopeptidase MepM/ murein hydrolase activator NlpD
MDYDLSIVKVVTPEIYTPKTNLVLPLKGKLIVWDGHDVHSLHRRFSTGSPAWRKKGITANSNRYAYDLVNINAKGEMYQGDPFRIENWFVFNKPVYAPAAGTVVDIQNDVPDNEFDKKNVTHSKLFNLTDPSILGNYVIIDNGDGEFTALLHMEKGSIKVKAGDAVAQGQQVGNVGFSGDATVPHLHVALMRGPKVMASEGVPSYFINYKLYHGNHVSEVKKGRIDSGDIIEDGN